MKTQVALMGLLALPTMAFAAGTPDGILGTNNVNAYGLYERSTADGVPHTDYKGYGLGINQNLVDNSSFGIDASFNYEYWLDSTSADASHYKCNVYDVGLTAFRRIGAFTPFVSAIVYYDTTSSAGLDGTFSAWYCTRLGVEIHPAAGWYVTPTIGLWERIHSDSTGSSAYADFSIETGYWFTERMAAYVNTYYRSADNSEQTWASLGVRFHY